MQKYLAFTIFAFLLVIPSVLPYAHATSASDSWYPGKGLKQGDFFRYNVCYTDWHNCTPFEMDFWVKNPTSDGGWNVEFAAIDGSIIQKGMMTIGSITPDPTSSDSNISDYTGVYRNTVSWLDAFATKDTPKSFDLPAWGRTGSVGGQSVNPAGHDKVTVHAGTFDTWTLGWHKGIDNVIWIDSSLPFPVKAQVYVDVTSGTPPPNYILELLQYGNSSTEPDFLSKIKSSGLVGVNSGCEKPDLQNNSVHDSVSTDTSSMIIDYRYSPSNPHNGCPVEFRLSFEKQFDQSQKYSNVQYDLFTVDDNGIQLFSQAQSIGQNSLFSPVGDDDITVVLKGTTPLTHVVIATFGTGAQGNLPDTSLSGNIKFDIKTQDALGSSSPSPPQSTPPANNSIQIPKWVKNNAKFWHDGSIDDITFAQGIQYMIQNRIITIPATQSGQSNPGVTIPSWVKNNAGYWSTGDIDDTTFVKGIQWLITNGIIQVS